MLTNNDSATHKSTNGALTSQDMARILDLAIKHLAYDPEASIPENADEQQVFGALKATLIAQGFIDTDLTELPQAEVVQVELKPVDAPNAAKPALATSNGDRPAPLAEGEEVYIKRQAIESARARFAKDTPGSRRHAAAQLLIDSAEKVFVFGSEEIKPIVEAANKVRFEKNSGSPFIRKSFVDERKAERQASRANEQTERIARMSENDPHFGDKVSRKCACCDHSIEIAGDVFLPKGVVHAESTKRGTVGNFFTDGKEGAPKSFCFKCASRLAGELGLADKKNARASWYKAFYRLSREIGDRIAAEKQRAQIMKRVDRYKDFAGSIANPNNGALKAVTVTNVVIEDGSAKVVAKKVTKPAKKAKGPSKQHGMKTIGNSLAALASITL